VTGSANAAPTAGADLVPRRTIILLAGSAFASSLNVRVCDPLLPDIAKAFDASVGKTAGIVTLFAIAYGLTQLLFGPLGDRYGKYRVVAIAAIAAGVATAVSAAMPTLGTLAAARFVTGGLAAAAIPLAFAWIGDAVPFEHRQPVLARFLSAQLSAIILAQAAGGVIGDLFGWRTAFVLVGIVHGIAGLMMLIELRANPNSQPPGATATYGLLTAIGGMLAIARRPWAAVLLATVFIEAFAMYGAFAYIGADLAHRFGLRPGAAGLVLAAYGFGAIAYSLSAKRLIAGLGERGLALWGGLLLAGTFAALAMAPSPWVVPGIMAAMGLGFYMLHNTLQTHATQMAPEARGLGVSLFALALFVGQSFGVGLNAPVVDRWGAPPIYLSAAILLVGITLWFRARLGARTTG
jgi:MFS transporter, YNFM family, putative membrane transport protein